MYVTIEVAAALNFHDPGTSALQLDTVHVVCEQGWGRAEYQAWYTIAGVGNIRLVAE